MDRVSREGKTPGCLELVIVGQGLWVRSRLVMMTMSDGRKALSRP
jgi:hypothetical protein